MKEDTTNAELIGSSSSAKPGRKAWTVLSLYYKPHRDTGRAFVAKVQGFHDGNEFQSNEIYVGDLDRALEYFKPSALTDELRMVADDWFERNEDRIDDDLGEEVSGDGSGQALPPVDGSSRVQTFHPVRGLTTTSLTHALGWLYQGEEGDLSKKASKDFGIPDRTIRDAMAKETAGQVLGGWVQGFIRSMAHFDRETWKSSRA